MTIEDFILVRRPLHHAIAHQEWNQLRRYLTEEVAMPSQDPMHDAVQKSDGCGLSPLMLAVKNEAEPAILRALAAHGADPGQEDNNGWTVLDWSNHICHQADVTSSTWHRKHGHRVVKSFLLQLLPPVLEFSIVDLRRETLSVLSPKARSKVLLVAAFSLASVPPVPSQDASLPCVLPQVDKMIEAMPAAIPVAFHLNGQCVKDLLSENKEAKRMIAGLCGERYQARHVQLNINSTHVERALLQSTKSAKLIAQLVLSHPKTLFLLPVLQAKDANGDGVGDSWAFVRQVLEASKRDSAGGKPAQNLVTLFDDHTATKESFEILKKLHNGEANGEQQRGQPKPKVGCTAGTSVEKLSRFAELAEEHGCAFIVSDSKTCSDQKETSLLSDIVSAVHEWESHRHLASTTEDFAARSRAGTLVTL
ncbi:nas-28 [Symbiodinium natans]|uniref:Nas-28 protein n=1 Tax=Symbiodinium natans TaxID=878477 RepID=A0A812UTN1_9DINO|nr:nas-28 [Symbiodinium natans]